jgi:Uma2 family endonuclease
MAPVRAEPTRTSYSDLQHLPEDGPRYELYDGEVVVVPAPVPRHQIVLCELLDVLLDYTRTHGGVVLVSPIDIVFSEYNVVQPDLVVFSPERAHYIKLDEAIRHAPDIAVEILSPSTSAIDRGRKMEMLARYGVPEYWMIDPRDARVEVYTLQADGFVLTQVASRTDHICSVALPDLAVPSARLFPF